jgi:hypothetical protein
MNDAIPMDCGKRKVMMTMTTTTTLGMILLTNQSTKQRRRACAMRVEHCPAAAFLCPVWIILYSQKSTTIIEKDTIMLNSPVLFES